MSAGEQTLWRRAAHTPARDWVRGRISGRLDWRAVIDRAGLPAPAAETVRRLVKRSRLWRLEKADLAAELCAHFADGLESGRDLEELMREFGNARRTATLIRRAKRRGRPAAYRAFVHTCQGLGMALLAGALAYGLLAWRYYTGEPTVTRNYTAEYNERVEQIPEEERAWPLYVQTYVEFERIPRGELQSWPAIAPEHPDYPDALAYLERQQDVIELAHRAAVKPHLGAKLSDVIDPRMAAADEQRTGAQPPWPEPAENPMMVTVLLPELGHFRELARLLAFDAHVAARAGERDRIVRDITTMLGIAEHACERPVLIGDLVGVAIEQLAVSTTGGIIHDHPDLLTDAQLRALAHRHAAFLGGRPAVSFEGERWFFEDVVQRVYSDDGDGNGHITAEGMRTLMGLTALGASNDLDMAPLAPIAAAVVADRADMTAKHDDLMTRMERNIGLPMWEYEERARVDQEIERLKADPIQNVRYLPITILMPALDKATKTDEIARQKRDGLLAGIALELYRRDFGRYPATLDALVPEYLPDVPMDRFTGSPLYYALEDGAPRLWSVGADLNNDHGRRPEKESGRIWDWMGPAQAQQAERTDPERIDGDWVIWPIVYEPVSADR